MRERGGIVFGSRMRIPKDGNMKNTEVWERKPSRDIFVTAGSIPIQTAPMVATDIRAPARRRKAQLATESSPTRNTVREPYAFFASVAAIVAK